MKNKNHKNRLYTPFFHNSIMPKGWRFSNLSKKLAAIVSIVVLVFVVGHFSPIQKAEALGIDVVTTTLTDSEALNTESRVQVVFTPTTLLIVTDVITIYLGDATGGTEWEDDDADQTLDDVSCSGTGYTFSPYTLTLATATTPFNITATVTAVSGTNQITCIIGTSSSDAPNNPTTPAGIYSVGVVTNDDSGAGAVYVADANDVNVSVTILPNLTMLLDAAGGGCSGTPVVTCNLGVVLLSTTVAGNFDVNVGTNATNGATLTINDNQSGTGIGDINDVTAGQTIDAGTSEFGASVAVDAAWTRAGDYLTPYTDIADAAETVATTAAPIAIGGNDITFTLGAAIDGTEAAGLQSSVITFTASGNF